MIENRNFPLCFNSVGYPKMLQYGKIQNRLRRIWTPNWNRSTRFPGSAWINWFCACPVPGYQWGLSRL